MKVILNGKVISEHSHSVSYEKDVLFVGEYAGGREYLLQNDTIEIRERDADPDSAKMQNKITELIKSERFKNSPSACEFAVELLRWLSYPHHIS